MFPINIRTPSQKTPVRSIDDLIVEPEDFANMSTVILGGGIIGLSTAYYLAQMEDASPIHIVDSSPVLFASASGYAGGFLALDWFDPAVSSLGALSFRLHRELAEKHNGPRKWGYAGSHTYSLSVDDSAAALGSEGKKSRGVDWLLEGTSRAELAKGNSDLGQRVQSPGDDDGGGPLLNDDGTPAVFTPQPGGSLETVAGPEECAQVEPKELCEFLLDECQKKGVHVHLSTKAVQVVTDEGGSLTGLKLRSISDSSSSGLDMVTTEEIKCKNVVICAGAWSPRVFRELFPQSKLRIPVTGLAGHSLTVRSPRYKIPFIDPDKRHIGGGEDNWLCYSIYCPPGKHWSYAPEAYARLARNGETEIWLGGLNDSTLQLPELAVDVKKMVNPESIKNLRETTVHLTGLSNEGHSIANQDDLETVREALCFRPVSQRGAPLIGRIPDKHLGEESRASDAGKGRGGCGVWIASGHGPWGISLSLGTGLVLSEMLMGKKPSADVRALAVR